MSEIETSTTPISPWRTVIACTVICVLQLVAFIYATHKGFDMNSAQAFGQLCMWTTVAALAVAGKALGEHLSNGTGIKGALSALISNTPAGSPAPSDVKPTP